jgi:L-ascorbate metabolism protein UlaG (beta-lactamase superfamily)
MGRGWWLLVSLVLALIGGRAEATCQPIAGVAKPAIKLASMGGLVGRVAALDQMLRLTFLGHASFLIESPEGASAVTDYNGYNVPARAPDVASMNIAHTSHYTDWPDPAIPHVLRGWGVEGKPTLHNLRVKDLNVRNVPTNIRDFAGGGIRSGNSIFVFEAAQLCVAHLGHLHHLLTPDHLAEMGKIDVLLVPVDGAYTLGQQFMLEVMRQIQAPINIPMHYFTRFTLDRFLESAKGEYAIRVSDTPTIILSRDLLPTDREILVLPGS